ncbi:MAG TPA: hypothetical protein VKQ54_17480 [Caulobacteraceae bacterium]|nr:hypothetical protein [Caulobacteraceae bacterium]
MNSPKLLFARVSRHMLATAIIVIAISESCLAVLISQKWATIDMKIGITAFTGLPLFLIGVLQLGQTLSLQKGSFIKDYISQFFIRQDVYSAWSDLIYQYTDKDFKRVQTIVDGFHEDNRNFSTSEEAMNLVASVAPDLPLGSRRYHPDHFQGTLEEKRLDALLGYFDVIGYYYAKGLLGLDDISGSMGYHVGVIRERAVVQWYLTMNKEYWKSGQLSAYSVTPPFSYLRRLMEDLKKYEARYAKAILALQAERI